MKRLDLTGTKIGELTVIGYSHSHVQPSGQKRAVWDVVCSCGIKKKISTANLTAKNKTISCGHVGRENRIKSRLKNGTETEENYLYLYYKKQAQYRNYVFEIEKNDFITFIKKDCFYCGSEPLNVKKSRSTKKLHLNYNGLDRIDSSIGYKKDNVVPCCKICNYMKRSMSQSDFYKHIKMVINHVEKRIK